jgi:hypothetical protein
MCRESLSIGVELIPSEMQYRQRSFGSLWFVLFAC